MVFTYTYDSVGNRLTQQTLTQTTVYTSDIANRPINVGAVTYTWDNNGNLLSDGVFSYTYDAANRLITATQGANTYTFKYNGLGDRLKQTANGVVTTYTLDLNAGLTQVLADGTNTYLYGLSRIGEQQLGGFAYHLADALGSVRQLTNASASVTLARNYEPYGSVMSSAGSGSSVFAFTGEQYDATTSLLYLRARYYSGNQGRFLTADTWPGDYQRPLTLNKWNYSLSNAVNYTDPSGHSPWPTKNIQAIQGLKPAILDSAQRHNTAQSGFTIEAFAALMAAHLNRESKFGAGNTWQSYGYDQFFDCLGKTFGYDASTGIANIRPSVGIEILRGELDVFPHSSGYTVQGSSYEEFIRENTRIIGGATVTPGDQDRELRRLVFIELQDQVLSVEYLAANIELGVDRAIGKGISPSVFNLASWLWRGVQRRDEFESAWRNEGKILNTHGAALVSDMPIAFQVLGLALTPYNAYNAYEADLVDGSFYYREVPQPMWP